jgi:hypothetical protein
MAFRFTAPVYRSNERARFSFLVAARLGLRRFLRSVISVDSTGTAIAILQTSSSSPDQCEWAERVLCGMVHGDAAAFMDRRQSQS